MRGPKSGGTVFDPGLFFVPGARAEHDRAARNPGCDQNCGHARLPDSPRHRPGAGRQNGEALVDYLGVSEKQLVKALQRMVNDGKYELAASLLESSGGRFAHSESVRKTERLIYLKLMEQYQNHDPFKFLLYSAKAGQQTPEVSR